MSHQLRRSGGFTLLEALVALLLVSLGLYAATKLQSVALLGSADAKNRSEAVTLSQKRLDELRNALRYSDYTTLLADAANVCSTQSGTSTTYTFCYTISKPVATLEQKLLQLTTTWTDRNANSRSLTLNTLISYDNPLLLAKPLPPGGPGKLPSGAATPGTGGTCGFCTPTNMLSDGSYRDPATNVTVIKDANNKILLSLSPVNNNPQMFTTISGRVYFDQNAPSSKIPPSGNVRLRLSSEGACLYDNSNGQLVSVSNASNSYKYFTYTCYVGKGWYGNVGVVVDDSVNGAAGDPTICVGDPAFNAGVNDGTLISANPVEASVRSYRGFVASGGSYLSTGVEQGRHYAVDGLPKPSSYPSYYSGVAAGSSDDYFNHHFLITSVSGSSSCYTKMQGGEFTRNSGQYYCISPDDDANADACPNVWPNFTVSNGGTINYTLTVAAAGQGTGTVTSSPAGISCGSTCSGSYASGSSVTLTATPANGSVFGGWSGACTGTGSCTVTMSASQSVTATFNSGPTTYLLSVTKNGTGTGTVSDVGANINCGATCSASYTSGSSVVLTALAGSGSTFTGWSGGGCSGAALTCTVSMTSAQNVTATFNVSAPSTYTLTVSKSGTGSGTVTSSPAGISCGSTCSASFNSGSTVTLTAAASGSSTFGGWSGGGCSGTGTCTVTMSQAQSVTATFNPPCTTTITGTAHDSQGSVSLSPTLSGSSCAMGNGNTSNYSCNLTHASGTIVTLTNSKTNGNAASQYSYALSVTANCLAQTNVNFP